MQHPPVTGVPPRPTRPMGLRRARWAADEASSAAEISQRATALRAMTTMYAIGPVVGFVAALMPHQGPFFAGPVVLIAASGLAIAGALRLFGRRLPRVGIDLLAFYAVGALTAADVLSQSGSSPFSLFLFWVVIHAALFESRLRLIAVLAMTVVGVAVSVVSNDSSGDGLIRWLTQSAAMALTGAVIFYQRAQSRNLTKMLDQQARTDPLTELGNRRAFESAVEREVRLVTRARGPFALALLDLDHLKRVNDVAGHLAGDRALRAAADAIRARLRATDDGFRPGGDEFAVLLRGCDAEQGAAVAEEMLDWLRQHHPGITLSVGVAACPDHGLDPDALVGAADAALYRAKQHGRDRVVVAAPPAAPLVEPPGTD